MMYVYAWKGIAFFCVLTTKTLLNAPTNLANSLNKKYFIYLH